jgi:hypothetical protein
MPDQLTKTLPALKEWALVCKLLLDSREREAIAGRVRATVG